MPQPAGLLLQPPSGIVLAAVFLWLIGSLGGIGMTVLSPQVRRMSRMWIMDRLAVHSLVGAMDYDLPVVNEIIFAIEAGLSFFHTHAEGMGLVVLAAGTVVATWIPWRRLRILLTTLIALGAAFPLGFGLYSVLIPLAGRDRGIGLAETLVLIPFGGATLLAMGVVAVSLLITRSARRLPGGGGAPADDPGARPRAMEPGEQEGQGPRRWQVPPLPLILAAVFLLALAETGGALMGRYKTDIREYAQEQAGARPAIHGLVGLDDVDAEVLDRVAVLLDAALRLFHMHGEGMALMLVGLGAIVQSAVAAGRFRTLLHLIGAGGFLYPLGYLAQAGLILFVGVDRARGASRMFVLWPAGGVLLAGIALLAGVLASRALRDARMRWAPAGAVAPLLAATILLPSTAWAHHTGTFIPGDTDLTANFKQIKAAAQAGRFDVALRLVDEGAFLDRVVDLQDRLFPGLKDGLRDALRAENFSRAELHWTAVMVYLARERVREVHRRLLDAALDDDTKMRHGQKILNGAWRYYNLVDLPIYGVDPKAASSLKVLFEDGQFYFGSSLPDPMWTSGEVLLRKETYNPAKAAQILVEMENTLTRVYDQLAYALSPQRAGGGAREGRWRGLITEITDDRITVRGEDDRLLTFRPSPRMGISPKHLREHMDRQVKVTVRYREEAGALRAVRITD